MLMVLVCAWAAWADIWGLLTDGQILVKKSEAPY